MATRHTEIWSTRKPRAACCVRGSLDFQKEMREFCPINICNYEAWKALAWGRRALLPTASARASRNSSSITKLGKHSTGTANDWEPICALQQQQQIHETITSKLDSQPPRPRTNVDVPIKNSKPKLEHPRRLSSAALSLSMASIGTRTSNQPNQSISQ